MPTVLEGGSVVIADEWPLLCLGLAQAVRAAGGSVVAEVRGGDEAVLQAGRHRAAFLLLGAIRDGNPPDVVRRARRLVPPPIVVVLVEPGRSLDLEGLAAAGAAGLLLRSVGLDELGAALGRVHAGERVVAPALLGGLMQGIAARRADDGAGPAGHPADAAGTPPPTGPESLTRKELAVLAQLAQGHSNREIADALFVAPATVKTHLAHIYDKLGVAGRQQALTRAVALGLVG